MRLSYNISRETLITLICLSIYLSVYFILQIYFLNEILSPLVTPFLLLFVFRPKALEIVKFFRSFTVSVRGVGNVCSFAQMDVRKFGNPDWQLADDNIVINTPPPHPPPPTNTNDESEKIATKIDTQRWPLENGKTELSLIRFTLTNPDWQMPETASKFVNDIRQHALADLHKVRAHCQEKNPLTESLVSFGSIGNEVIIIHMSFYIFWLFLD